MNIELWKNIKINNFNIFITPVSVDFFDVLVSENKDQYVFYIDLNKDLRFPIEYKFPPKLSKNSEKLEEMIYKEEYSAYEARKIMSMPLWKLHRNNLQKIITIMQNITN